MKLARNDQVAEKEKFYEGASWPQFDDVFYEGACYLRCDLHLTYLFLL